MANFTAGNQGYGSNYHRGGFQGQQDIRRVALSRYAASHGINSDTTIILNSLGYTQVTQENYPEILRKLMEIKNET